MSPFKSHSVDGLREYLGIEKAPYLTNPEILGKVYRWVLEAIEFEMYPKAAAIVLFAFFGAMNMGVDAQELEYSQ